MDIFIEHEFENMLLSTFFFLQSIGFQKYDTTVKHNGNTNKKMKRLIQAQQGEKKKKEKLIKMTAEYQYNSSITTKKAKFHAPAIQIAPQCIYVMVRVEYSKQWIRVHDMKY